MKKRGVRTSADKRFQQISGRQEGIRRVTSGGAARGSQSLVQVDSHGVSLKEAQGLDTPG